MIKGLIFILLLLLLSTGVYWFFLKPSYPLFGVALDGEVTQKKLTEISSTLKISPGIVVIFLGWPKEPLEKNPYFPDPSIQAILTSGAVPCITFEPMVFEGGKEYPILGEKILRGDYDPYLRFISQKIKAVPSPVIFRLAHEMNLERYHWFTSQENYGPSSPIIYQKVFRYIARLFAQEGVDNALFAFCPNVDSNPSSPWNDPLNYYPGDDVVALFGMDGYNWGEGLQVGSPPWHSEWKSFSQIFSPLYQKLKKISSRKPIIVFETASVDGKIDRKKWLEEAISVCVEWDIQAVVWFQVNKERDWQLDLLTQDSVKQLKGAEFSKSWAESLMKERAELQK